MAVGDAHVSWHSHTSTNTNFFPKPPTTFLTCFSREKRGKYARKKFCLIWVSNSQPPGHESHTLTTEPLGQGRRNASNQHFILFPQFFQRSFSLTLSQATNFRLFHSWKSLQTAILSLMKMTKFSKWKENTVGKGEIACFEQFLLFPQCFRKTCTAETYN